MFCKTGGERADLVLANQPDRHSSAEPKRGARVARSAPAPAPRHETTRPAPAGSGWTAAQPIAARRFSSSLSRNWLVVSQV
jgi:hypothetical protein